MKPDSHGTADRKYHHTAQQTANGREDSRLEMDNSIADEQTTAQHLADSTNTADSKQHSRQQQQTANETEHSSRKHTA